VQHTTPPATAELDEALLRECRQLLDRASTGDQGDRGQAAVMSSELLDRATNALRQGLMTAPYYARVLRACAKMRNMAGLADLPPDPLVHDLIAHTVQYGLAAANAAAQALRGTLAVSRGSIGEALDAAIDAMATLELLDEHTVERALAISDTANLLDRLGLADRAADLHGQAAAVFDSAGNTGYAVMSLAEQVHSKLLHALWLQRTGGEAGPWFDTAAALASDALRRYEQQDPPVELDILADFHAALALAEPRAAHGPALRNAANRYVQPGQMLAALALARVLAAEGRADEAAGVLTEVRLASQRVQLPLPLRLALAAGTLPLPADAGDELGSYVMVLEQQLWAAREALARALHSGLEYERLRRGREPMRMVTARDPVTRLPNRSVLDERLARVGAGDCVAMVDVDDLVMVNQRGSYADGDNVLRALAVTVRNAVRADDSVVRYSGDEFVVVMPGRTLDEAAATMREIVAAVNALPYDRGLGVTVSIGVVAVEPTEDGESALVRADNAMTQARSRGGNQVAVDPLTPSPR
jgi:diguanylate cyclase